MKHYENSEQIQTCLYVARAQKGVIWSIALVLPVFFLSFGLLFALLVWLGFFTNPNQLTRQEVIGQLTLFFMLLAFIVRFPLTVFCFRLYSFFNATWLGFILFVLMSLLSAVDILGSIFFWIFVLVPFSKASKYLRKNGIRIGFFGANLKQLKQRLQQAQEREEAQEAHRLYHFTQTEQVKWSELMEGAVQNEAEQLTRPQIGPEQNTTEQTAWSQAETNQNMWPQAEPTQANHVGIAPLLDTVEQSTQTPAWSVKRFWEAKKKMSGR